MKKVQKIEIAIDASRAFVHERTGIEEYSYQVIKYLRTPLENQEVILYVRFYSETAENPKKWIEKYFFNLPNKWKICVIRHCRLWTQIGLSWRMLMDQPRVLFVPAHTVPFVHPRQTVVVIHGLEYEMTPKAYSLWARIYMRLFIKASCRWSSKIITVSENTKKDVSQLYGIPEDKMTVIYEGVNEKIQKELEQREVCESLPDVPYFLFVGRIEERKNIVRVIKAFDIFKQSTKLEHKLILVGGRGYGYEDIQKARDDAQFRDDIVETGFVSEEEKWQFIESAQVFIFTTLYEGFGLPILEAQSMGVPVITSTVSSLPEVAGDSAALVDPENKQEIADAMERLVSDEALRRDIIARGFINIKRFSWEKCAKEIAELL